LKARRQSKQSSTKRLSGAKANKGAKVKSGPNKTAKSPASSAKQNKGSKSFAKISKSARASPQNLSAMDEDMELQSLENELSAELPDIPDFGGAGKFEDSQSDLELPKPPSLDEAKQPSLSLPKAPKKPGFFARLFAAKPREVRPDELDEMERSLEEAEITDIPLPPIKIEKDDITKSEIPKSGISKITAHELGFVPSAETKSTIMAKAVSPVSGDSVFPEKSSDKKMQAKMGQPAKKGKVKAGKAKTELEFEESQLDGELPAPPESGMPSPPAESAPTPQKPKVSFFSLFRKKPKIETQTATSMDTIMLPPMAIEPDTLPESAPQPMLSGKDEKKKSKLKGKEKKAGKDSQKDSQPVLSLPEESADAKAKLASAPDMAMQSRIDDLHHAKKKMEMEIQEHSAHLEALHVQKKNKQREIDEKHKELVKKEIEVAERERLIQEKQQQHADLHEDLQKKLLQQGIMEGSIKNYDTEMKRMEEQLDKLAATREQLKDENQRLRTDLNEKERELNNKERIILEDSKKLEKAGKDLERSKKEHVEMHELLTRRQMEFETKAKLLEDFEKKRKTAETEIGRLKIQKEKLDMELLETNEYMAKKIAEKQAGENEAKGIRKELDSLKRQLQNNRDEIKSSESELKAVKSELKKKQEQLSKLEKKIAKKTPKETTDPAARNILQIMDDLLGKLPEPVIDEFAKSSEFENYEKIMSRYGLGKQ